MHDCVADCLCLCHPLQRAVAQTVGTCPEHGRTLFTLTHDGRASVAWRCDRCGRLPAAGKEADF
jgi:hypothetical protein